MPKVTKAVEPNRTERGQEESKNFFLAKKSVMFIAGILILFGLYFSSLYNYLLFHSLAEIFSIVVAWAIFILAWNSRRIMDNNYLLFIGIAFLFIGGLDLVHTLGYKGMGIFHGYAANLPTQLWIAARYMESLSLLIAPLFLSRRLRTDLVLMIYAVVTLFVLGSVFYWHIFPACFVEGVGLTPFKKISEYIISVILIGAITLLFQKRKEFDERVFRLLVAAMVITIAAELAFTFYISAYGFSNLVGHYFKIISFYLVYKAIIETGLTKPYALLFRDLKQSEEALRKEKDLSENLIDTAQVIILLLDTEGRIVRFNPYMEDLCGYRLDEVQGKDWFSTFLPEQDYDRVREVFKTAISNIQTQGNINPIVLRDGREIIVEWYDKTLKDVDGKTIGLLATGQDITEKRRLQAQVQETQKMEAIATLSGGIAHEFNNALMGIMGNIELLKMDLPEDEGTDKSFEAMKNSGHRMSRLTSQLLAYAEGGKYQPRDLKMDVFVVQTVPILQHELNPAVRVETHFQKDTSYIKADHTQMQMVLSAIVANSNEAIEDKGLIKITAGNKDIDEDFTKQHPGLKPGPYVCLVIEDDGKGMDEETRSGIFEPFFTTKFQGRGMGMAAVYGIIKSHDGFIYVDSELGKGTVVRIYLPAIEAKEEVKKDMGPRPTIELATGEGTILVIEDEEPLVELFRKILERLGYRVLQARTGKEAVEFAKTFDGQIDLALLDIKLPDMEGGRVYPLIMEARPDLKVIVCSGYSIHGPAQAILDAGAEGFIQKPFLIAPFAEKLKEVLKGK